MYLQIIQTLFRHFASGCSRALRGQFLLTGFGFVLSCAVTAQVNLPDIGDSSQSALSSHAERELGDQIIRQIRATTAIMDDPQVSQYIQSLGYELVSESDSQYLGFEFFVIGDTGVNAFALPGGYIGVNAGLILASASESELASVIAHEIAHVTQRHIARFVEENANSGFKALAGILAAIAVGMVNSEAGKATAALVLGGQAQSQLNFSRSNEQEADRIGMQLLDKAQFDPSAMASFFEKLQGSARYYRRPPEYLSSHPVTSSRIAETRDRALQLGYRQHLDSIDYRLIQARVRVLTAQSKQKILEFYSQALEREKQSADIGIRYGLALAQAQNNLFQPALNSLQQISENNPKSIPISMSLAEMYSQSGDQKAALAIYEERFNLYPGNYLVIVQFTKALLQSGDSARVLKLLNEYKRLKGLDAPLLRVMAEALEAEGREAESQATLAEHFYQNGDLHSALQQLIRASQHSTNSFYLASRIEARLEIVKNEISLRNKE